MKAKSQLKLVAISLREKGKSYSQIQSLLPERVAKSTLSYWCSNTPLLPEQIAILHERAVRGIERAHVIAKLKKAEYRQKYFKSMRDSLAFTPALLAQRETGKLALAMLYAAEGGKRMRGSLMFGNSDPYLIALFLKLLRNCYLVNETRFRCTLQCRADQDTDSLQEFWSKITGIPPKQFYKPRIDPRTIGKPSRKPDYKGVCRLDYFSADVYNELTLLNELIRESILGPVV